MIQTLFSTNAATTGSDVARRLSALTTSMALHAALIATAVFIVDHLPTDQSDGPVGRLSIRLLQMEPVQAPGAHKSNTRLSADAPGGHEGSGSPGAGSKLAGRARMQPTERTEMAVVEPPPRPRLFVPPVPQHKDVKQTLIQMDVPDITLKSNVPVPAALIWAQNIAKPAPVQFVAPARKQVPKPALSLPSAPTLDPPNRETKISDMRFTAVPVAQASLVRPPSTTSPVQVMGPDEGKQLPETTQPASNQASSGRLISIPDTPLSASGVLAVPPANQSAAQLGGGGSGMGPNSGSLSHGDTEGRGSLSGKGSGAGDSAIGGAGGDHSGGNGGNGSVASGNGNGGQNGGSGAGSKGTGTQRAGLSGTGGAEGDGGGSASTSSSASGGGSRRGATRVVQPRDGHFSVVVMGSSSREAYPESAGVLGGKLVYTVYLHVGLKKKWILQYCSVKASQPIAVAKGTATAVEAPWPILMMRPDIVMGTDLDYVMIHGFVTAAGKFEQLALVVPTELHDRDLLLGFLRDWEFRPASRDGVPTPVEILLIIPREAA
jgi:hypothetical protein